MKKPNINLDICIAELESELSGYKGYPPTQAGVRRFASALQEYCVSVGHMRAVLASFIEFFPTVRQIMDVAMNIRQQFEAPKETRADWERQYGKPEAFDKYPPDALAMHWTAIRDMLYYTEGPGEGKGGRDWDEARLYDLRHHAETVDFIRHQVRELGWKAIRELTASPIPFPYKNPRHAGRASKLPALVPVGAPLTEADIDSARQSRKSTAQVDTELDGWDNPDR